MRAGAARRGREERWRTTLVARARLGRAARRAPRAGPAQAPAAPADARDSAPPTPALPRRPRASRRCSTLLPQLLELLPRAGVDDIGLRQPAPPGLRHRELEVGLRADLMTVGGDDKLQSGLLRGTGMDVAQIEPVRLAVDLEEGARLERPYDHPPDVDVPCRALRDPAARAATAAVDVRVLHRLEHTLGRARIRRLMDGRNDPVEQGEIL